MELPIVQNAAPSAQEQSQEPDNNDRMAPGAGADAHNVEEDQENNENAERDRAQGDENVRRAVGGNVDVVDMAEEIEPNSHPMTKGVTYVWCLLSCCLVLLFYTHQKITLDPGFPCWTTPYLKYISSNEPLACVGDSNSKRTIEEKISFCLVVLLFLVFPALSLFGLLYSIASTSYPKCLIPIRCLRPPHLYMYPFMLTLLFLFTTEMGESFSMLMNSTNPAFKLGDYLISTAVTLFWLYTCVNYLVCIALTYYNLYRAMEHRQRVAPVQED